MSVLGGRRHTGSVTTRVCAYACVCCAEQVMSVSTGIEALKNKKLSKEEVAKLFTIQTSGKTLHVQATKAASLGSSPAPHLSSMRTHASR